MVGVSTHTIEQVRAAVLDGADYLGVGPVFPSRTKSFDQFPGLGLRPGRFERDVASRVSHSEASHPRMSIAGRRGGRTRIAVAVGGRGADDPERTALANSIASSGAIRATGRVSAENRGVSEGMLGASLSSRDGGRSE